MDRNIPKIGTLRNTHKSLSARRAWIEMGGGLGGAAPQGVALRKESVDRNIVEIHPDGRLTWSLSARRAWIEILSGLWAYLKGVTSLSARRAWIEIQETNQASGTAPSLSARRAWIEIISGSMMVHGDLSRSPQGERG